jgi:multisubunit Na+/H+ antiporter MnhF subunit
MMISRDGITAAQSRDTGMAMVLILLLCGWLLDNQLYFKLAIPVLILTMAAPAAFKPAARVWFKLSMVLGTVATKVILSLVFYLVVTPVGLIRRILGYDALYLRKFKHSHESVMKIRSIQFSRENIEKPY